MNYKISIEWAQIMEATDKDHMSFLKNFFNSMMRLNKQFKKFNIRIELIKPDLQTMIAVITMIQKNLMKMSWVLKRKLSAKMGSWKSQDEEMEQR